MLQIHDLILREVARLFNLHLDEAMAHPLLFPSAMAMAVNSDENIIDDQLGGSCMLVQTTQSALLGLLRWRCRRRRI